MSLVSIRDDGCWEWRGTVHKRSGYGNLSIGSRGSAKHYRPHRLAYMHWVGPLAPEAVLDHVCHTEAVRAGTCAGGPGCAHRRCVNPEHLEHVPQRENLMRGITRAAANAAKTHCHRGHEFTKANTHIKPDGARSCRRCAADRAKVRSDEKRGGPAPVPYAQRTHCPQGHPYDEENTYRPPGKSSRMCRECLRQRNRQRRAAQKATA